ncbi:MAG: T9SS type A sorting domain-containing protein [Crocinitomicaceae bacterium]|nr:T9SS type A sorting domain-containing protein [Crocinitomicaceae bacterium]
MKKILLFGSLLGGLALTLSMISNEGTFQKYHSDGSNETASSVNPPAAKTGAPGESNCTGCHSGTAQSAAGTVDFTFDGTSYIPSQTYNITISNATAGAKNGFQMTILDDGENAAGTFAAGTGSGTTTSGGRNYIRQTSSVGVTSWTFQWTAPATDMGNLTAYYSYAESNNNGSTSGETVYLGQSTIPVDATLSLSKYEEIEDQYKVFYNDFTQQLNVEYALYSDANIVIQLIDLNGKLIQEMNLGSQFSGEHLEQINLPSGLQSGLYFVSMFQDNLVFNKKVFLP